MINGKKQVGRFVFLCALIYFISYVTRTNYGAVLSEMVSSTGLSKSELSVALTGSFITYGAGQLVSGYMGDHIHPKKLLAAGLLATSILNLLIPICPSASMMAVVWCINGFAQSFMWPPLVKTMLMLLSYEDYEAKIVNVGYGSSGGTIFVYLAAPLCILISGWKLMFIVSGVIGLIGLVIWQKKCPSFTLTYPERKMTDTRKQKNTRLVTPLLIVAVIGILLQGILRDGVATYMPSFIAETYHLSNEISILTGVLLPIFSLVSCKLAAKIHRSHIPNLLTFATILFLICTGMAVPLYFFYEKAPALSVALLVILNACTHGVNLMLISYLPAKLADREHLSTMAGLTNSFAYIGSAVSTYLIPLAAEGYGWNATLLIWAISALLGVIVCAAGIPMYHKKLKKSAV
ncbi:MAG: MFS transporter [Oscillospiraceae bacterium]|nr:MFS transporter [Oscillospiraceae bacterium]